MFPQHNFQNKLEWVTLLKIKSFHHPECKLES